MLIHDGGAPNNLKANFSTDSRKHLSKSITCPCMYVNICTGLHKLVRPSLNLIQRNRRIKHWNCYITDKFDLAIKQRIVPSRGPVG
jgi:hypothetical protein